MSSIVKSKVKSSQIVYWTKQQSVSRPDRQSGGTRRARQLIHIQNEYNKQKHIYTHIYIHAIPIVTETHFNFQINSFACILAKLIYFPNFFKDIAKV